MLRLPMSWLAAGEEDSAKMSDSPTRRLGQNERRAARLK